MSKKWNMIHSQNDTRIIGHIVIELPIWLVQMIIALGRF